MKALLLLLVMGVLGNVVAAPHHVEVWFISPPSAVAEKLLPTPFNHLTKVAVNECIPMGDGCFHPQLGFVAKDEKKEKLEKSDITPPNIMEVDLIQCDKNYYFDLYCGKAFKKVAGGTEVWIDISTSIRRIDSTKGVNCKRREFVEKLQVACSKIDFFTFNTNLKPMGSPSELCTYRGTNSIDNFMRWVRDSDAKRLIVITDVDEYTRRLQVFLDSIGAHIRGIGTTPLLVNSLDRLYGELDSLCKQGKIQ